MAKYYRHQGETKRHRSIRIVRPIVALTLVVFIVLGSFFAYDIFSQNDVSETSSASTRPVSSVLARDVQVQTTPYFQIQTPMKWRAIANETRDGHYVYRQLNGPLVEQELIIDVNDSAQLIVPLANISRVLPVSVNQRNGFTIVDSTLEHCKKAAGSQKSPLMVTMQKVSFPCTPDTTIYKAVVGLVGGGNVMTLTRPSGKTAPYKIQYHNMTANPGPGDFVDIIETFETR